MLEPMIRRAAASSPAERSLLGKVGGGVVAFVVRGTAR
jgi:hypothetical protein